MPNPATRFGLFYVSPNGVPLRPFDPSFELRPIFAEYEMVSLTYLFVSARSARVARDSVVDLLVERWTDPQTRQSLHDWADQVRCPGRPMLIDDLPIKVDRQALLRAVRSRVNIVPIQPSSILEIG